MNTCIIMLLTLGAYFLLLLAVSQKSVQRADNDAFFRAGRRSRWWMVAFGMIGASISGVSFVSVPAWVASTGMTYLQMCAGFVVGYLAVAFVLLPVYYRLRLTSIYSYLSERFGRRSHQTGTMFFLLSKLTGAAARLYLVCIVLEAFVFRTLGIPFTLGVLGLLLLVWLYTRRGGIQTLVRTDALQTLCMLLALGGVIWAAAETLGLDLQGIWQTIRESPMSQVFDWDWASRQNFWKQFLSGMFVVIVMTGLDQDMMQKNLTCSSLREAQKDMCAYGACFLPVNALFLGLGVLLYAVCAQRGIPVPAQADSLLPSLVASGVLGTAVVLPFTIGIVSAAFSSADSAITALTTTACIDLLDIERPKVPRHRAERIRRWVHVAVIAAFVGCIWLFRLAGSASIINTIYVMASYTYGPLLGLYFFGLFSRRRVRDGVVPAGCVLAPMLCAALDYGAPLWWDYTFGYELLMLNGALTAGWLWLISRPEP